MISSSPLPRALLALRVTIFVVMLVWAIDKGLRPEHAAGVFGKFYGLSGIPTLGFKLIAGLELALLLAFVLGAWKRLTYGLVLLLHGVSTVASFPQYLHPFEGANLLFFAAWPMLAACYALYALRESDTLATL